MTALRRYRQAIAVPLLLAATTAAFAWKLLFTGLVVIGYDTMTYMYPYRVFAAEALRDGRIPLWNPWIFFGVPFLANLQSAVFYPFHAIFLVLPGPFAMNASVTLHFFLAAWFTALAARGVARLDWWSAGIAGVLYGFSGFVGAQVGHLNQLNAAAWLPLATLTLHRALEAHAIRWAVATGAILAVQLLAGHAQESYMTVLALAAYTTFHIAQAAWTLALPHRAPDGDQLGAWARSLVTTSPAEEAARTEDSVAREVGSSLVAPRADRPKGSDHFWSSVQRRHPRWHAWTRHAAWSGALLALAGALAGGLGAVQALPTTELTAVSIRAGGMSFGEAISFSLPPRELFIGLLPTFGTASPTSNEFLGWIGFGGASLVLAGITFRARHPAVLFFAILALVALLLALGNHTPIYGRIFRLPGMNLFRVPARWLFLSTFGASIVGGAGFAFLRAPSPTAARISFAPHPWFRLIAASRLLLAIAVVTAAAVATWPLQNVRTDPAASGLVPIWLALGAGALLMIFATLAAAPSRVAAAILTAAVTAELGAAGASLEYNNPNPPGVYTDSRPSIDALHDLLPPGRVLAVARTGYQPFDAPQIQGDHGNILGLRGVGAGLINTKYKDTLNPNLPMVFGIPVVDGYDGGVLPFRRYVDFKSLIVGPDRNQPDGLLRDQLGPDQTRTLPTPDRLRQWGVTYVLRDTVGDHLVDGAYYDADASIDLAPGAAIRIPAPILALPAVLKTPDAPPGSAPTGATWDATDPSPTPRLADLRAVAIVASRPDSDVSGAASVVVTLTDTTGHTVWTGRLGVAPFGSTSSDAGAIATRLPGDTKPPGTFILRLPIAQVETVAPATRIESVTVRLDITGPRTPEARATLHSLTLIGDGQSWPLALAHGGAMPLVHRSDTKIYRLTDPPARARIAQRAVVVPTDADALAALSDTPDEGTVVLTAAPTRSPDTSLRGRVRDAIARMWRILGRDDDAGYLTGGEHPEIAAASGGEVTIEADSPEAIRLRATSPVPTVVVIRDTFFAGWRATVDGKPAPIWRADLLFRAVPISAGDHVIEMTFHQTTYEVGRAITVASLVIVVALLLLPVTTARRRAWPPIPLPAAGLRTTRDDAARRTDDSEHPHIERALTRRFETGVGGPGDRWSDSFEASRAATSDVAAGVAVNLATDDAVVPEWTNDDSVASTAATPGLHLDDDANTGGLYIAWRDADPEVARESTRPSPARRPRPPVDPPKSAEPPSPTTTT